MRGSVDEGDPGIPEAAHSGRARSNANSSTAEGCDEATDDSGDVTNDLGDVIQDAGDVIQGSGSVEVVIDDVTSDLGSVTNDLADVTTDGGDVNTDAASNSSNVPSDIGDVTTDIGDVTWEQHEWGNYILFESETPVKTCPLTRLPSLPQVHSYSKKKAAEKPSELPSTAKNIGYSIPDPMAVSLAVHPQDFGGSSDPKESQRSPPAYFTFESDLATGTGPATVTTQESIRKEATRESSADVTADNKNSTRTDDVSSSGKCHILPVLHEGIVCHNLTQRPGSGSSDPDCSTENVKCYLPLSKDQSGSNDFSADVPLLGGSSGVHGNPDPQDLVVKVNPDPVRRHKLLPQDSLLIACRKSGKMYPRLLKPPDPTSPKDSILDNVSNSDPEKRPLSAKFVDDDEGAAVIMSPVVGPFVARGSHVLTPAPPHVGDYLPLACVVTFCCNPLCGVIAVILAVKGSQLYQRERYLAAKKHALCSFGLSMAGIIITLCLVTGLVIGYWPESKS